MKRILLLSIFILGFLNSQAQWVSIPDSNFGKWLTLTYPTCMQGNPQMGFQMDTSCSGIVTATNIDVYGFQIYSIEGVEYFTACTQLTCSGNTLTSLSRLPSSLTVLNCEYNQLTSLPALPSTLTSLYCNFNQLTSLPSLPSSIYELNCTNNQLTSLPFLPSSLAFLDCSLNQLTSLPALPIALIRLACNENQLSCLPALPDSLFELACNYNQLSCFLSLPALLSRLNCSNNQLINLPILPSSLRSLYSSFNQLDSLPALPSSLNELDCNNNRLTQLPLLPSSLTYLYCNSNQLNSLPPLTNSLTVLRCSNNQLTSLPTLPSSLTELICHTNPNLSCIPNKLGNLTNFYFGGTQINCMPNRFSCQYFDIDPNSLSLCNPLSGCNFYYNITGITHQKTASTCLQDSLNPGTGLSNIKMLLESNVQTIQQTYAYSSGEYSFDTDSNVAYTVKVDTTGLPFTVACPVSTERNVLLTNMDSVKYNQDFGLECKGVDVGVASMQSRFRAGRVGVVNILAGDITKQLYKANCATNISGTVTTTITGSASYVSPSLGALSPSSVSGNTLIYTITDFSALNANAFDIVVATDTQAQIGSNICISVVVTTTATDINVANNSLTLCFPVVNSYDPNAKEVSPTASAMSGDWLTYTVHFQNTGNDTAYDVTVRDTLSSLLDVESFQFLASSHAKKVIQIKGNAIAFSFPNINLVDSATNPMGSQGWFQFRVKSKKNLPLNTAIKNTAFIYFDFNPAIKTNTATFKVEALGISSLSTTAKINLYPNPNQGVFTLSAPTQIGKAWQITDVLGRNIASGIVQKEIEYIQLENASKGVYILSCGGQQLRVVVQ